MASVLATVVVHITLEQSVRRERITSRRVTVASDLQPAIHGPALPEIWHHARSVGGSATVGRDLNTESPGLREVSPDQRGRWSPNDPPFSWQERQYFRDVLAPRDRVLVALLGLMPRACIGLSTASAMHSGCPVADAATSGQPIRGIRDDDGPLRVIGTRQHVLPSAH
jgi:hypothetical protein